MKNGFRVIALGLAMGLAGCAFHSDGPYGGHGAKWYEHHHKQAIAEAKWCRAGSSHRQNSASCNAVAQSIQDQLNKDFFGSGTQKSPNLHVGPSVLHNMKPIPIN